jgi:diguanylate cyclase (GGDEF)-like protein
LANRALCRERLIHALARAGRDEGMACVLFIDLDDFKAVNDLYGHAAGDALLIALARRLVATVRPADTVARLGAAGFPVTMPAAGVLSVPAPGPEAAVAWAENELKQVYGA